MQKGNIGVTSQDIFPLIKKFMYNDQDIFIREIVSNAVDASEKLIKVISANEYTANPDDLKVTVTINHEDNTITVSDMGIGMTADEIEKYINQIAFSGANDFLEKYKDTQIIGHFGLGFYSSFMVSSKVEIVSKSYKENSKACKWTCEGTTEFTLKDDDKESVGTDVIMHISDEYKEYVNESKLMELLKKYAEYLPIQIYLKDVPAPTTDSSTGEVTYPEPHETKITRDEPLWLKSASELKDEDYIKFYKETFPNRPEPLFWIHINIDTPFTFKGILYFPAFDQKHPIFERKHLNLYCNRVFVTDDVDGVLPDYLSLLHGVIDSPDIPLNVSRSVLQNDANVKKISSHITNKVMSSLRTLMKKDRETYEKKWETIKTFINLGVVTEPNIFDKAKDIILLVDTDNKMYTFDEYYDKVSETQKDKDGKIVYLYTYDTATQYTYIDALKKYGYNILLFNSQYGAFEVHTFEMKLQEKNVTFKRIDADVPENLIKKEDDTTKKEKPVSENIKSMLVSMFDCIELNLPKITHQYIVQQDGKDALPITIVADEFFRRMKEMSMLNNAGMYLENNASIKIIINADSKVVKKIIKIAEKEIGQQINDINEKVKDINTRLEAADTDDAKNSIKKELDNIIAEKKEIINKHAHADSHIHELIDIGLLQYGLLSGEDLASFVKRSIKMIEK